MKSIEDSQIEQALVDSFLLRSRATMTRVAVRTLSRNIRTLTGLTHALSIGHDEYVVRDSASEVWIWLDNTDCAEILHAVLTYAMLGERRFCRLRSSA